MADEVSDVFSVMARSGELLVQVIRPLAERRGPRETRLDKKIKKGQLKSLQAERARALLQKMAQGQIPAERLLEAYGPGRVQYARLSSSQLPDMMEAAGKIRVPYSVIHLPTDPDGNRDVLIAYCRDHAPSVEAILEMTKAELLSEKEGSTLAETGVPEAVEDFGRFFARSEYKPEDLTFLTCFVHPEDAAAAGSVLDQAGVAHLASDELGVVRMDQRCNTCLTFFGDDMERAASALREARVRLEKAQPEILHTEVIAREAHAHKLHRARFEAQEAAKIHFSELTEIPLAQAEPLITEMRREGISVIADYGEKTADILIADDDLECTRECLKRSEITKELRSVSPQELRKHWEGDRSGDVQILRERAQAGRRRKENSRSASAHRISSRGGEKGER